MTRINDPKFPFQNHVTGFLIQLSGINSVKKSCHLGNQKAGTKKEIVEFNLHFKCSILFLDASTVQVLTETQHLRQIFFPPIFLLQNKSSFSIFIHNESATRP